MGAFLPVNSFIDDNSKPTYIISFKASSVFSKILVSSNFSKYILIVAPTEPVPLNLKIILDLKFC